MSKKFQNESIIRLALPIFFQMLLTMCLGYIDTAMLSHYSQNSVGAVGNANQIIGFLQLTFIVISSATSVIVAQSIGAEKSEEEMNKIYTVAISFNFVLSLLICIFITCFNAKLLRLINIPSQMYSDSLQYMQIVGLFLFCNALTNLFAQIFNCNGKTQVGMIISFAINLVNITGNFLFLYGPFSFLNLGTKGVALSTSFSNLTGFIVSFICFRKIIKGRFSIKFLKPYPFSLLNKLLKIGIPAAGEKFSYSISQILITTVVNTLGTVSVNTKIYCSMLTLFSIIFSNSIASATSIVTGHLVGSSNYDYAQKRVNKSLFFAMILSLILASLNYLLCPLTIKLFTSEITVVQLAQKIMFIGFFLEIGRCTNLVVIQSMRAAGDVLFPTILGVFSMWGVSVLFSYILALPMGFGLCGVWIAMAADEILRGIVVFFRWQRGSWKNKKVITD